MGEQFGAAVSWLPYDLHPEYPPEGVPRTEHAATSSAQRMFEANGFVYNPPAHRRSNSRAALRLAELARDQGRFDEVHRRLMDAYWDAGLNIGDHGVLAELAAESGVEGVEELLAGDRYLDRVLASTEEAQSLGISGIPAFLLGRRLLVLGAHPRGTFERAFRQLENG
jgi:predicted DsbA family dithiol-disulfide isomerase